MLGSLCSKQSFNSVMRPTFPSTILFVCTTSPLIALLYILPRAGFSSIVSPFSPATVPNLIYCHLYHATSDPPTTKHRVSTWSNSPINFPPFLQHLSSSNSPQRTTLPSPPMVKKERSLYPQSIWDEEAVLDAFDKYGINKAHHDKFMRSVYEQFQTGQITSLDQYQVPDQGLSPKVYKITQSPDFVLMTTKVIRREDSKDKSTTKLLIELQDGEHIETVLMRYSNTQTQEHTRTTICVSSQIGCAQACSFCATGLLGLSGSLTQGEILEQYVWCDSQVESVRNLVFMGQGEPLSNEVYKNVMSAVRILTTPNRFSLRQNRVTVSTVGVVDNMYRTIDECPGITIALSLHAPTQSMRQQIVPSARKYSLKELVDVIDYYHTKTGKKMLIEYVMLDDVNASEETAHLLGKLLQGRGVLINLIPFNPVLTKAKHVAPSHETVGKFAEIVASYGLLTTTRKEFGQDISGACGQLSSSAKKYKKEQEKKKGYTIVDDFTPDEAAVIRGHNLEIEEEKVDPVEKTTTTTTTTTTTNNHEEDDVVDDGLEGLVSAFGWMGPDGQKNTSNGEYVDTAEIGVTRQDLVDNTTSCSGEPISSPNATMDMEDLLLNPKTAPKPTQSTKHADKLVQNESVCEENCGCHRDQKHDAVVKGIDPRDIINWSLAVISLGPRLKVEQEVTLRKKGETEKARLKRLLNQQLIPNQSLAEQENAMFNDECVVGDEENDHFDDIASVGGGLESKGTKRTQGDNLSQRTGMTGVSMTSSQLRVKGAVSSLKLQPREKDLLARVVIPKKEAIEAAQGKTTDLEQAGWDMTPTTFKHDTSTPEPAEPANTNNSPQNVSLPTPNDDAQHKMIVLAVIAIVTAILLARRVM